MHALAARGLELRGLTSDTALAAYLALPGQRSFDLADLALRYLNRELRDAEPASGQLTLDVADDSEVAAALAHAGGGHRRAGRRAGPGPGRARCHRAAGAGGAAAGRRAGRDGAGRHRRRLRALRRHVGRARRRGEVGRAGRVRRDRARVQPGLAQAAAGSAVHRAGTAQDQADQDRLHHRLRGADRPAGSDRAPGARRICSGTGTWPSSRASWTH